jgi:hypothetical protein
MPLAYTSGWNPSDTSSTGRSKVAASCRWVAPIGSCPSRFNNTYAREILDRTMLVPGKAIAEAVDLAGESGTPIRRKPEELYDNSFVQSGKERFSKRDLGE